MFFGNFTVLKAGVFRKVVRLVKREDSWASAGDDQVAFGHRIASQDSILDRLIGNLEIGNKNGRVTPPHRLPNLTLIRRASLQCYLVHIPTGNLHQDSHCFVFGKCQRVWRRLQDLDVNSRNSSDVRSGEHGASY